MSLIQRTQLQATIYDQLIFNDFEINENKSTNNLEINNNGVNLMVFDQNKNVNILSNINTNNIITNKLNTNQLTTNTLISNNNISTNELTTNNITNNNNISTNTISTNNITNNDTITTNNIITNKLNINENYNNTIFNINIHLTTGVSNVYYPIATISKDLGGVQLKGLIGGYEKIQGRASIDLSFWGRNTFEVVGEVRGYIGTQDLEVYDNNDNFYKIYIKANEYCQVNLYLINTFGNILYNGQGTTTTPLGTLVYKLSSNLGDKNINYRTDTGNLGLSVFNPQYKLDINGDINLRNGQIYFNSNNNTRIKHFNGSLSFITNNTENLKIMSNGNIGIGTNSPSNKLDIIGNTYISGNIGIGTNNPITKLHIVDNSCNTIQHINIQLGITPILYYPICIIHSGSGGTHIHGLIGAHESIQGRSYIDLAFWARGSFQVIGNINGDLNYQDILVYNNNNVYTLYVKVSNYAQVNLELKNTYGSILWNGTGNTTTPSGILVFQATTGLGATNVFNYDINGNIKKNGTIYYPKKLKELDSEIYTEQNNIIIKKGIVERIKVDINNNSFISPQTNYLMTTDTSIYTPTLRLGTASSDTIQNPYIYFHRGSSPTDFSHYEGALWLDGAGNLSFANASDIRLKENIIDYEKGYDKIKQLRTVEYEWKDTQKKNDIGRVVGFIAQEVKQVLPKAVGTFTKNDTEYLNISETNMIPFLWSGLRKTIQDKELLETKNTELENRVNLLEEKVNNLENIILEINQKLNNL